MQNQDESWAQRLPLVSLPNARGSGNRAALELHKVRLCLIMLFAKLSLSRLPSLMPGYANLCRKADLQIGAA